MEDAPTTKTAIQERNTRAFAAFDQALAELTVEQLEAPQTVGEWSLKDTLAHLSSTWLTGQIEAYLDGREPTALETFGFEHAPGPGEDMSTNDGRNAWTHSIEKHMTTAQVRDRYADYRRRTAAILERLPEEDFERLFTLAPLGHWQQLRPATPGEQFAVPLWRWLAGNTWHHFEDHLLAFQQAAREA